MRCFAPEKQGTLAYIFASFLAATRCCSRQRSGRRYGRGSGRYGRRSGRYSIGHRGRRRRYGTVSILDHGRRRQHQTGDDDEKHFPKGLYVQSRPLSEVEGPHPGIRNRVPHGFSFCRKELHKEKIHQATHFHSAGNKSDTSWCAKAGPNHVAGYITCFSRVLP